ncbi:MAG: methyl-accepting chemotaxis protein [Steroidobacteraceae bacterium]
MRQNTGAGQEYLLGDEDVIITHTDLQSRITYANQAFIDSSGYSLEECMGKPQNLVRHPDMPKLAFRDLWRTIKAGQPWTGLVKNRRKNGGFYWVRANVSPIVQNGQKIGYLSVRVKPTRAEIDAAEALYERINAGRTFGLSLDGGVVSDRSPLGMIRSVLAMPSDVVIPSAIAGLALLFGYAWMAVGAGGSSALRAVCAAGAVLSIALAAFVRVRVSGAIAELRAAGEAIVAGDMRMQFPLVKDPALRSLAGVLNQVNAKLKGVMTDTRGAVQQMLGGVQQIVEENTQMSNRAGESAANLEETAASIEELTSTVKSNSENAERATRLAREATEVTERGGAVVSEVAGAMAGIATSARRIAEIVGIIDSIAFQTNLLALNASVEAARAGEQGRGFAVVAQEVRNLAQRSAAAAKDIRDLISSSVATVDRGQSLVGQAETTMQNVVRSVKEAAGVIQEIGGANREQSEGINQINQSVLQLDETTQRNAQMAQHLAEVASGLQEQADQVMRVLQAFAMRDSAAGAPGGCGTGRSRGGEAQACRRHRRGRDGRRGCLTPERPARSGCGPAGHCGGARKANGPRDRSRGPPTDLCRRLGRRGGAAARRCAGPTSWSSTSPWRPAACGGPGPSGGSCRRNPGRSCRAASCCRPCPSSTPGIQKRPQSSAPQR